MVIKGLVVTMVAAFWRKIDLNNQRQKESNNGKSVKGLSQFHYQKEL